MCLNSRASAITEDSLVQVYLPSSQLPRENENCAGSMTMTPQGGGLKVLVPNPKVYHFLTI